MTSERLKWHRRVYSDVRRCFNSSVSNPINWTFVTTATLFYINCLFELMHCNCQSREVRWRAAERGTICQKPILFLHNSKARKSKVRCKPCRPLRSPESHNKSHKNCHYRDYFSLSLQSPSSSVVHTFQQRALHAQCDRNGQLLACFSALP